MESSRDRSIDWFLYDRNLRHERVKANRNYDPRFKNSRNLHQRGENGFHKVGYIYIKSIGVLRTQSKI